MWYKTLLYFTESITKGSSKSLLTKTQLLSKINLLTYTKTSSKSKKSSWVGWSFSHCISYGLLNCYIYYLLCGFLWVWCTGHTSDTWLNMNSSQFSTGHTMFLRKEDITIKMQWKMTNKLIMRTILQKRVRKRLLRRVSNHCIR